MPRPRAKSGPSGITIMKSRTLTSCTAATSSTMNRSLGAAGFCAVTADLQRRYTGGFRAEGDPTHELRSGRPKPGPRAQAALAGALGADDPHARGGGGGRGLALGP